jgi:hypothetical protein
VEPAGALFTKNLIPIKITWLQLRCCGVAAIRTSDCTADPEASLRKVQAVAYGPTDPIVSGPLQKRGVDSALKNEIFHEASHFIIGKGTEKGGAKAEAAT